MFFLPGAMPRFGKRNESLIMAINCPTQFFLPRAHRVIMKSFAGYFMYPSQGLNSILLFHVVAIKMMVKNWNLQCSLPNYWISTEERLKKFLAMIMLSVN